MNSQMRKLAIHVKRLKSTGTVRVLPPDLPTWCSGVSWQSLMTLTSTSRWLSFNSAPSRQRKRRQQLVEHYQSMLRKGGVRQLIEELSPHRHAHEAVEACCRYFGNNVDRMKYDQYTAHGLQTGSGVVEDAYKHVVATPMKKTGPAGARLGLTLS